MADVWDRSFYIHIGTFLHQILCWAHRKRGAVCFCTCIDMMPCLILCEGHSLRAAHLLCRRIDRFLHPALCWAHKYGILQTCLEEHRKVAQLSEFCFVWFWFCTPTLVFLHGKKQHPIHTLRHFRNKYKSKEKQCSLMLEIKKNNQPLKSTLIISSLGKSKYGTTINPLSKTTYQNLQGE